MDEFNRENQNNGMEPDNRDNANNTDNMNYVFEAEEMYANDIQNQMAQETMAPEDLRQQEPEGGVNQEPKQYQAATYSYKKSDLGPDSVYYSNSVHTDVRNASWQEHAGAGNDYQNGAASNGAYQNIAAQNYASSYSTGGGSKKKGGKKSSGFAKKAGKVVAAAAAFGLVAGLVFQGVNRTADALFPRNQISEPATVQSTSSIAPTTTSQISAASDLTELVENTMPSIVSITSTVSQDFSYFGQVYSQEYDGSGSGIIVAQNGDELLIVTNNHVVENAKAIAVNFINDKVYEAKIKGTDKSADLAVIAVDMKNMDQETQNAIKIATLGDSEKVKVGQMAIAIGNALGSGQSVTVGYISAKNRQINTSGTSQGSQLELLQTDAAINPGNSGGALLNVNGEVIGINDMKYADTDVEGMGYAIPISEAIPIINELMNRETLTEDEKGYLGINGFDITENNNYYDMPIGVWVGKVISGAAAEEAGIKKGDIITKINGATVKTVDAVAEKVNSIRAGKEVTVTVMRSINGEYQEMDIKVTLKNKSSVENQPTESTGEELKGNFGYTPENGEQNGNGGSSNPQQGEEPDLNDIFNEFFNQGN